jgi:hypothetical protein
MTRDIERPKDHSPQPASPGPVCRCPGCDRNQIVKPITGPKNMTKNILMAATIALFMIAHGFALHEIHATDQIGLSPEKLPTYGD